MMADPLLDYINASFEFVGVLMCALNVRRIWIDKVVRGVSWPAVMFFALWGWWNLLYYPALGQTYSFWAGVLLTITNSLWVILLIYYSKTEERAIKALYEKLKAETYRRRDYE